MFRDANDEVIALEAERVAGEISSDNTVVYPNLWSVGHATYEYSKRGLVQDVILERMPEFPSGFVPERVEVWTAWTGQEPVRQSKAAVELRRDAKGTATDEDEFISFGHMRLVGEGTAFALDKRAERATVAKSWIAAAPKISWLIESVDFRAVESSLSRLPKVKLQAALRPRSVKTLLASVPVMDTLSVPKGLLAASPKRPTELAMVQTPRQFTAEAFVLDFTLLNGMVVPDGMRAWWSADGNGSDESSYGNQATAYNSVSYDSGKVGSAWLLDGSTKHARAETSSSLQFGGAITVACWVKPSSSGNWANLISKWDAVPNNNQMCWTAGLYPDNRPYFGVCPDGTGNSSASALATTALPIGEWSHVVGSYDGTYVSIYVNGQLQNQAYYTAGMYAGTAPVGLGACVGGLPAGQCSYALDGSLDEAGIYARCLSPTEVSDLYYAAGYTPPQCVSAPSGMVGWWSANSYSWADVLGGGSASPVNGASFSSGGVVEQSFSFDGVDDYASVPNTAALNPASGLTVEAWVYCNGNLGQNMALVSKDDCSVNRQYFLTVSENETFRAHVKTVNGLVWFDGYTVVQANTWYHVAMTYDGAYLRLYVNGVLDSSSPATGSIVTTSEPVHIGGSHSGGWGAYKFAGQIDEVSIYGRALYQSELAAIYSASSAGKCVPSTGGTVGEAIDQAGWSFSEGGEAMWFLQAATTYDGSDAAQSGDISHSQASYFETTVNGPGTVSFYWKVSSEGNYDFLKFKVDGTQVGQISGDIDWTQTSFAISAGTHTLRWEYSKDSSVDSGADAGWVDWVDYVGPTPPAITTQPQSQTVAALGSATFSVSANGTAPLEYQWYHNGNLLTGATGSTLALQGIEPSQAGAYTVRVANSQGEVTSSPATLTVTEPDTDADTLPDWWEIKYYGSLGQSASSDTDSDGLTAAQEKALGSNPTLQDSDGDGLTDLEETTIPIDSDNLSLGYLSPATDDTGATGTLDGDKDSDHDGLPNLGELREYGSKPTKARTFNSEVLDSEYVFTAKMDAAGGRTRLSLVTELGGPTYRILKIRGANAYEVFDVYFARPAVPPNRPRRVLGGIKCDSDGRATFRLDEPDPVAAMFFLAAAKDTDGDGLSDGYEALVSHTNTGARESDEDKMWDGWEEAYGLNPADSTPPNGGSSNLDSDFINGVALSNLKEYNNNNTFTAPQYDPLRSGAANSRPVVSISVTDGVAGGSEGTATFQIRRNGGSTEEALKVYYCLGGDADYLIDYTLDQPSPTYPVINSVEIPEGAQSISVTLTPTQLRTSGEAHRTVHVKLTPFVVGTTNSTKLAPDRWDYVVNVFQQSAEITILNHLPGLNGPVYAMKLYKILHVESGETEVCTEHWYVIVGGEFTQAGSVSVRNIARFNGDTKEWEPMGTGVDGPVYAIETVHQAGIDAQPDIYVGGEFTSPGSRIAKYQYNQQQQVWSWTTLGLGVTSDNFLDDDVCSVRAIRQKDNALWVGGRFRSAGNVVSPNLAQWNLATAQWQSLVGSIIFDNITYNGPGINSQWVMVTAIDEASASIGMSPSGVTPLVPASRLNSEAFYQVDGANLRGKNRMVSRAGVKAVSGSIAGHEYLEVPWSAPVHAEEYSINHSGLSQLTVNEWDLLGYGGTANLSGTSPFWPATAPRYSGWKVIGDVNALAAYGNERFVGGAFDMLSGAVANGTIADYAGFGSLFRWNGSAWSKLENAPGQSCLPAGVAGVGGQTSPSVYAMQMFIPVCESSGGPVLWVAGNFASAGGGYAGNIASYRIDGASGYWDVPAIPVVNSPAAGARFMQPATVALSADACGAEKVEFWEGNRLIGSDSSAPFSCTWTAVPGGQHAIKAVAFLAEGKVSISQPRIFEVNDHPYVYLSAPEHLQQLDASSGFTLKASATDRDGSVSRVEFYANDILIGTDYTSPFTSDWAGQAPGAYQLNVKAFDNDGGSTYSGSTSVTVVP